jgi:hypothetical protein
MTPSRSADHAIPLAEGQWSVWRDALLRSAGFPVDGLTLFATPECARAADNYLAGTARLAEFDDAFSKASESNSAGIYRLASNPQLSKAIAWQSLSALIAVDKLLAAGLEPRRNSKHRARERLLVRYWQRYCGKAETVGFFGPVCWARIDPLEPAVLVRPGADVIRDRRVYFEHWSLALLAERIAAEPAVRQWLSPGLSPQLTLRGRTVIDPVRPPVVLTIPQAEILSRCDGSKPACQVAEEALSDGSTELRSAADVHLLLSQLAAQGILQWDFDLPVSFDAERLLDERIARVEDADARAAAAVRFDVLRVQRALVAAAERPGELASALHRLESIFTDVCGHAAVRNEGKMYAGRTLCVEETIRDLDATFGTVVIQAIEAPLVIPLTIARWLCGAMATAYLAELERLHAQLADDFPDGEVPLGSLWFLAQDAFYGVEQVPARQVSLELAGRWSQLFGLESAVARSSLTFSSAALTAPLAELFPADGPLWAGARIHSPDLQLCANSVAALGRGEFSVVMSEMHAAWTAAGFAYAVFGHPEPGKLRDALWRDMAGQSVYQLLPVAWPRNMARLAFALEDTSDTQLAFAAAPGADRRRLVPTSSLVVKRSGTGLIAVADDGRSWPLIEIFGRQLSEVAVEALKATGVTPHMPRITVDRLVLARESWRMKVADCPVAVAVGEREEYLATRRWTSALGLPDYVFVKVSTEVKPIFIDTTSPIYASVLAAALRAARRVQGDDASLTVTEMLPGPDESWLPDAEGRRYVAELRLHVRDNCAIRGKSRGAP